MFSKKIEWFKIANSVEELIFPANNLMIAEVNRKKITLAKFKDGLYACAYACPHASGVMAEGNLNALGNVVCPIHRYRFNLQNGRNTSGEGYYLTTYPIEMREDGVFVGMAEKSFFNF